MTEQSNPETENESADNDADGFVANFWRATAHDPEAVARHADWPVNENDLHARHSWLVGQRESITARLEGDPDWYDPKVAGWWCWGQCCWIGGGWCSGKGPSKPPYVIGKSSGTISARSGTTPGSGSVILYFDNSGTLTASGETITVKNLSSTATSGDVWVGCAYDGIDYWLDWEDYCLDCLEQGGPPP